jgi:DNA-binding CsgD family transcriptional regulator
MRTLAELRDPLALLLAVAAAVTLLAFQEGPLVAVLAALSVLVVRIAARPVFDRLRPRPASAPPPRFPPPPPGQPWYFPLTRRESEVALLVAEGLTNREIGERLHSERTVDGHVTERGVDSHVQNIMNSLNMNRRTQISAWVTERRPREIASKPPPPR